MLKVGLKFGVINLFVVSLVQINDRVSCSRLRNAFAWYFVHRCCHCPRFLAYLAKLLSYVELDNSS